MSPLTDAPTQALVLLAAAIATGRDSIVRERARAAIDAEVPALWVDELLLQSILMVGYPRSLSGFAVWRDVAGSPPRSGEDGTELARYPEWVARGERTCRVVYGDNYDKLRANVRQLHPAVDAWMVAEGYGKTLSRPGLDLGRRELCVVAQVAVLGAERQLHSHLRGALNAGVGAAELEQMLELVLPDVDPDFAASARRLWSSIRP